MVETSYALRMARVWLYGSAPIDIKNRLVQRSTIIIAIRCVKHFHYEMQSALHVKRKSSTAKENHTVPLILF